MVWRADPSRRWALLARRLSRSHIGERRDGVSLVELLLGLGILVTMTAMAIPLLLTFQRDATALSPSISGRGYPTLGGVSSRPTQRWTTRGVKRGRSHWHSN
jgi:hypothetical protein